MTAARWLHLGLASALAVACTLPREEARTREDRTCTRCHGDATREGDALVKAAPGVDTAGRTATSTPGVGAHALHLSGGPGYAPVACAECHRVPATTGEPGHNDGTVDVVFGPIATRDGGSFPEYEPGARTCTNSGCHGRVSGEWTSPRSSAEVCGACHGLPPPAPHPQGGACEVCHADVVSSGGIHNGALHVNGQVEVAALACGACHGEGDGGAPPRALDGGTAVTHRGVGAHAAHLSGGRFSRPVVCETCHEVPDRLVTARHPNGGAAEVDAQLRYLPALQTCTTSCHRGTSPAWSSADAGLGCDGCHESPPAAPHPQVTQCGLCHANAAAPFVDRGLHVNGTVEVTQPSACDGCHGDATTAAPPRDLDGGTDPTRPGVGAHRAHVVGRGLARVVPCAECHAVPATVVAPGHLDGVTQVRFSGVARSNQATPSYAGGTCASAACHDIANFTQAPGGGQHTSPTWTLVDGSQATCTSCHGLPPPAPHVARTDCEACHTNVNAAHTGFTRPELHVNGQVEFVVP